MGAQTTIADPRIDGISRQAGARQAVTHPRQGESVCTTGRPASPVRRPARPYSHTVAGRPSAYRPRRLGADEWRRPAGRAVSYPPSDVRLSRTAHPAEQAPSTEWVSVKGLVVAALTSALVVTGLWGLAQARTGADSAPAQSSVSVVQTTY